MPPKKQLTEVAHLNAIFRIGDACTINPPGEGPVPPYIGKILEIKPQGPGKDDVALKVCWYYRPEEALGGRKAFHGEKELFESDHVDEIHLRTILKKCFVHGLRKYESLAEIKDEDFFSRFKYKPGQKEFLPDKVPVYCTCGQPYNPDRPMLHCNDCEDWFHHDCIGMTLEELQAVNRDSYLCPTCCPSTSREHESKRARVLF